MDAKTASSVKQKEEIHNHCYLVTDVFFSGLIVITKILIFDIWNQHAFTINMKHSCL